MEQAESDALLATQNALIDQYTLDHRFTSGDIRAMHRLWLGGIYAWAGEYRNVNVGKGDFMFAAAPQVPRLMAVFEQHELKQSTPCHGMDQARLTVALARAHAELVLIHPFREGNGRCARLLAMLMGLQAGMPPLVFSALAGRRRAAYYAAVQAATGRNYEPMEVCFAAVIRQTLRASGILP